MLNTYILYLTRRVINIYLTHVRWGTFLPIYIHAIPTLLLMYTASLLPGFAWVIYTVRFLRLG